MKTKVQHTTNNFKTEIIAAMQESYKMLRTQKESTAHRLGKKVTIDSLAYPYVLCDEMSSYLISAQLSEEDIRILHSCPDIYMKALNYFLHHSDVRFEAYAKCIAAILEEEKNTKDAG